MDIEYIKDNYIFEKLNESHNLDDFECEIEDLFDDELLELKLGNKVFDRSGKKDSKKYYSKDIFSKYVMKNYDDINFERFRPFLNNLNAIIKLWINDMTKPS